MTGPPSDPVAVAELAVLGTAAGGLDGAREAAGLLQPRHFRDDAHQAVFAAILALADAPDPVVEPAAIIAEMGRAGRLGGDGDLDRAALVRALPGLAGDIAHHAPRVLAAWQQRNIRSVLAAAADLADDPGWDPETGPGRIRDLIGDATSHAGPSRLRWHVQDLDALLDDLDKGATPALTTGYPSLDEATGGLFPGQMVIIAARPTVGKTLLGLGIADWIATELDLPVLYQSLEMPAAQLTARRIAARVGVPLRRLTRHELTEVDWVMIKDAYDTLASTQLRIDDTSPAGIPQIRAQLAGMAREGAPAAVHILDYLGLAQTPRAESRNLAIGTLGRAYRQVAKDYRIPVIALCQLNRNPEGRRGGKPTLSDLRESGDLEQDSDQVWLLHRDPAEQTGEVEVIVAKNRQGPPATVKLTFQGNYGRIADPARAWTPGAHGDL
jgi:replicative DNA helicase